MRRAVQTALIIAIVLDVVYWAIWFTRRDWIASLDSEGYYMFENAFPAADLWLGLTCVFSLWAMAKRRPIAMFWLICAGSSGVYLFSMDTLFDLENGVFSTGAGGYFELFIVVMTAVFSVLVLTYAWGHRGKLLAGDSALVLHRA